MNALRHCLICCAITLCIVININSVQAANTRRQISGTNNNGNSGNSIFDFSYLTPTNFILNVVSFFQQPYRAIPSNLDPNKIEFQLYTRRNPNEPTIFRLGEMQKLKISNFDYDKPTFFFTHGWLSSPNFPVQMPIHTLILKKKDANVFLVDWSAASMSLENQMLANVPLVGKQFGDFINWLKKNGPLKLDQVHLIGFSMGSHISGMAARRITDGRPMRVTGIDPPGIFNGKYKERVRKGDADYVEVIHSSINSFGQKKPLGNADFYPNWGLNMPGCLTVVCNHVRALDYFINSIEEDEVFMGYQCKDYDEILSLQCSNMSQMPMGGLDNKNATGVYYLPTKSSPPFYMENR